MTRDLDHIYNELMVIEAQIGDRDALRLLVERWHKPLLRHASRLTPDAAAAADVTQEAWLAIARGLGRLDDPARFAGWAYRVVSNKAADLANRRKRERAVAKSADAPAPADPARVDDEETELIRAAIARLPDDRRVLLCMRYVDGLSITSIATALELAEGTVKSRLYHAKAELRSMVDRSMDKEDSNGRA